MYLMARKYESSFGGDLKYPDDLKELEEDIRDRNFLSAQTCYQIGYWRKFNALHNWFVKECANGEDNCRPIYVDYDQLEELLNILIEIKNDHSKAEKLLPTQSGFFFGSTDYNEWYFEDIDYTIKLLNKVLKLNRNNYAIYYEASW